MRELICRGTDWLPHHPSLSFKVKHKFSTLRHTHARAYIAHTCAQTCMCTRTLMGILKFSVNALAPNCESARSKIQRSSNNWFQPNHIRLWTLVFFMHLLFCSLFHPPIFGSEMSWLPREWGGWLKRYGSIKHKGHFAWKGKLISQQPECAVTFTKLSRPFSPDFTRISLRFSAIVRSKRVSLPAPWYFTEN